MQITHLVLLSSCSNFSMASPLLSITSSINTTLYREMIWKKHYMLSQCIQRVVLIIAVNQYEESPWWGSRRRPCLWPFSVPGSFHWRLRSSFWLQMIKMFFRAWIWETCCSNWMNMGNRRRTRGNWGRWSVGNYEEDAAFGFVENESTVSTVSALWCRSDMQHRGLYLWGNIWSSQTSHTHFQAETSFRL